MATREVWKPRRALSIRQPHPGSGPQGAKAGVMRLALALSTSAYIWQPTLGLGTQKAAGWD